MARSRDLGGLIFVGLRDHAGVLQVVIEPENKPAFAVGEKLRNEFCIKGDRQSSAASRKPVESGHAYRQKVELLADSVELLNASAPLPLLDE